MGICSHSAFMTMNGRFWAAQVLGGTGTFSGMKGGGTTKKLHTWPDGSFLISWEGTMAR